MSDLLNKLKAFKLPTEILKIDGFEKGITVRLVNRDELNIAVAEILPLVEQFDKLQAMGDMGTEEITAMFMDMLNLFPEKVSTLAAFFMDGIDLSGDYAETLAVINELPIATTMRIASGGFRFNLQAFKSAFDEGKGVWQGLFSQAPQPQEATA